MKKIANASDFYPLISALTILIMKVKVVLCWSFAAILSLLRPIESLAVVSIWKRIWSHCLEFNNFKLFVDLAAFWSSCWFGSLLIILLKKQLEIFVLYKAPWSFYDLNNRNMSRIAGRCPISFPALHLLILVGPSSFMLVVGNG